MSLYRQAGGRGAGLIAAALAAGILLGGLIGYLIGDGGGDGGSLSDQVAELRSDLEPVSSGLSVVPIEYAESVKDGRVVSEPEYNAAIAAVDRSLFAFSEVREGLDALNPSTAETTAAAIERLRELIGNRARSQEVESQAQVAARLVGALAGGPSGAP